MRRGKFPAKTNPYLAYATEPGLLMRWNQRLFGEKNVQVPIADVAGEDIQVLINKYKRGELSPVAEANYNAARKLVDYVKGADGFILTVPASKALIYKDGEQKERESSEVDYDPDVNLARILGDVYHYKKQVVHHDIKGIAVVITKWDLISKDAENMGIDIYTPEGLKHFMNVYFPSTSQVLGWYGLNNVRFFPSYVDLQRNQDGTVKKWNDGAGEKIEIVNRDYYGRPTRRPSYDERSYVNLIEYLKTFAS